MTNQFKPGDEVLDGHAFNALPIGTVLRDRDEWIHTKVRDAVLDDEGNNSEPHTTDALYDGENYTFASVWNWGAVVVSLPEGHEVEENVLARPQIDFSGSRYETARGYARFLVTPKSPEKAEDRSVLASIANGYTVDAYEANRAVLAAMRSLATRFSDSSARKLHARRAAHLGHIVQAVIENHADRLPAYEQGVRSRKIETLEGELTTLKQAASDERRRLVAEIEDQREISRLHESTAAEAISVGEALSKSLASAEDSAREAWAEVARLQRVLDYTRQIATSNVSQRSRGYDDGTRPLN